jgi:putative spermidine/putrescine transport system substrate-binding protein
MNGSNLRIQYLAISIMAVASLLLYGCKRPHEAEPLAPIVVVSYGSGAWQKAHEKAFCEPFTRISGVPIRSIAWNAEYGKLKTDVNADHVTWDVVEVTAAQYIRGVRDRLYEAISIPINTNDYVKGAIQSCAIANVYWSTVLAFLPDQFRDAKPSSWADFWDISRFPGPRALCDNPRCNLEFALLAEGVKPGQLYPLDIDRAFASLDKLKPYIKVWWEDGSQPIQLLRSKQVVLSTAWSGRLFAANQDGARVDWIWNGAAHDIDYWVIPRGTAHKGVAERFLWFASQPYPMAEQTQAVGYGPANIRALELVPATLRAQLPTERVNYEQGFLIDSLWWSENEAAILERWVKWKAR